METWHKVEGGKIVKTVNVRKRPRDIATGKDGNPVWRQEVRETVDNSTTPDAVWEKSEPLIESDRVLVVTTVRDLTEAEIATRTAESFDVEIDGAVSSTIGKALFAIVNELRSSRSQKPLTKGEFRDWLSRQGK